MTTKFIKELQLAIAEQTKINKSAELFIAKRKLKKHPLRVNFSLEELPTETHLGSVFMIKNNSIIEIYSYLCNDVIDIRFSAVPDPYYKCTAIMHNINPSDICDFVNSKIFDNPDDLVSLDLDRTMNFITVLLKTKFEMYIK